MALHYLFPHAYKFERKDLELEWLLQLEGNGILEIVDFNTFGLKQLFGIVGNQIRDMAFIRLEKGEKELYEDIIKILGLQEEEGNDQERKIVNLVGEIIKNKEQFSIYNELKTLLAKFDWGIGSEPLCEKYERENFVNYFADLTRLKINYKAYFYSIKQPIREFLKFYLVKEPVELTGKFIFDVHKRMEKLEKEEKKKADEKKRTQWSETLERRGYVKVNGMYRKKRA